jgi:hypothetical protein
LPFLPLFWRNQICALTTSSTIVPSLVSLSYPN